jgi:hypothetical protein
VASAHACPHLLAAPPLTARDTAMPPADAAPACLPGRPGASIRKPTWPDNGLIAVDRYWTATAGVLADPRPRQRCLRLATLTRWGSQAGAKVADDLGDSRAMRSLGRSTGSAFASELIPGILPGREFRPSLSHPGPEAKRVETNAVRRQAGAEDCADLVDTRRGSG